MARAQQSARAFAARHKRLMGLAVLAALGLTVGILVGEGTFTASSSLTDAGSAFLGGTNSVPGEIVDFPAMVENTGSHAARLVSAKLVPVPGFKTPKLVRLAVLKEHRNLITSAIGWPVSICNLMRGAKCLDGTVYRTVPFHGYVVRPHGRHGRGPLPDMIEYGVVGASVGAYGVAGIVVTYSVDGSLHSARLLDAGEDCVSRSDIREAACEGTRFNTMYEKVLRGAS